MELTIEYLPIKSLKPYERNTRKHTDYDVGEIAKSIAECGFNDPIGVYGESLTIVEGHGRLLAAKKLGMKEVPCIRLDHMTDDQRRKYAILHNKTAELSAFDFDNLAIELEDLDFSNFDFTFGIEDEEEELEYSADDTEESFYTEKTEIPQYQPTGENVSLSDCFEDDKYKELLGKINNSSVTDDEKRFLICAATRHYRFTYKKIAEYYAQASEEMQYLMEQSALVIIDYENAIRNGYLKLRNRLEGIRNEK